MERIRLKGWDTTAGGAGYCLACKEFMPEGPDRCLGYLPNVRAACCGHAGAHPPYVYLEGEEFARYDQEAVDFLANLGIGVPEGTLFTPEWSELCTQMWWVEEREKRGKTVTVKGSPSPAVLSSAGAAR